MFSGSGIQFILQQAAFNLGVKKYHLSAGAKADLFCQIGVARKDVAGVPGAFLFEKIADAMVS